jgi:hypothetical protein
MRTRELARTAGPAVLCNGRIAMKSGAELQTETGTAHHTKRTAFRCEGVAVIAALHNKVVKDWGVSDPGINQ